MITIPEYVYNDNTIEFVCPALELAREDAARMRAVLTDPSWPYMLDEVKYICHTFHTLGFHSTVVSDALVERYDNESLEGCIENELPGRENRNKRYRIATLIRPLWCQHMRDCLEKTLKQG